MTERRAYTPRTLAEREWDDFLDDTPAPGRAKPRLVTVPIPDVPVEMRTDHAWLPESLKRAPSRIANKTYIIRCADFVKIGIAHDVEARFRALQSANPFPLDCLIVLAGGRAVERELHQRFAAYRVRDEWFRLEGALAKWIDAGCPHGT